MSELVQIYQIMFGEEKVNATNSRELYKKLGLAKKQYLRWITNYVENYDFEEGFDYVMSNKDVTKTYIISTDMAKEICMMTNNEIGSKIRKYYISLERKLCDTTQTQLETKDKQIKQLKERGYAKPRTGDFQLVDRIRQDYNIQASTHDLNKLLKDNKVLIDVPYWKSNFLPNEESDFSIKQGKSTLVYTSTLLSLVDKVGIVRLLGHEDINQRLF